MRRLFVCASIGLLVCSHPAATTTTPPASVVQAGGARELLAQADALRAQGTKISLEASIERYALAAKAARASGFREIEARALLGRGIAMNWLGRETQALPFLTEARTGLAAVGDRAGEAEALTFYADVLRHHQKNAEAVAALKEAIRLARLAGDRRVEGLAWSTLGWTGELEDRSHTVANRRAALETAIKIQRELPDKHDLSMSLSGLGLAIQGADGPKAAIPYYEEARAVATEGKSPRAMGQAISLLGFAYSQLGEADKAIAFYRESLPPTQAAGYLAQEPYTRDGLARLLYSRGRARETLAEFREVLRIRQELDDRQALGFAWHNVGVLSSILGDPAEAMVCFGKALEIHRANKDTREEATTLLAIGSEERKSGNPRAALARTETALALYRELKDDPRERAALGDMGLSLAALGRYREAIEAYESVLRLAQTPESPTGDAGTLRLLGRLQALLGERRLATTNLERAVDIAEKAKQAAEATVALTELARVQLDAGEPAVARELLERARVRVRATDIPMIEARVFDALAELALKTNRPDEALTLLDQSMQARRRGGTQLDEAVVFLNMGRAHRARGETAAAGDWYRRALTSSRTSSTAETEALALVELMHLAAQQGQGPVAVFHGKQAISRFQEARANLGQRDITLQRAYVDARAQVYRDLAGILIADGRLLEAQQVLDLLKEQEFRDYVRRQGPGAGPGQSVDLTPAESASVSIVSNMIARIAAIGRERGELLTKKNRTPVEESRLAEVDGLLTVQNEEFARFMRDLTARLEPTGQTAVRLAEWKNAQSLMETLRTLGTGTVAVYTLVSRDEYYVMLVTPDARVKGSFAITAANLNQKVMAFRQALENPRVDPRPLAQELYKILLAPIAPALEHARAQTLMWSLDGALRYVSVAALHDGKQYLAEKYRSVLFTSASTASLSDLSSPRWTGVGAGVSRAAGEFSALPAVPDELRAIFRGQGGSTRGLLDGPVLLDEAFTADAFRATLRERRPVVHVATHFQFRPGNETDSFLLLGDGTRMTLAEVNSAPNIFGGVELLALSACNTAVGDNNASGAEVEGFAVMAQQQGAKAVLASLWSVADASTRSFMEAFYRARLRGRTSKAQALREAQLALLRGSGRSQAAPARGLTNPATGQDFVPPGGAPYAHPYYWAPFILMGNWR
jgi:CHAT domain-containing protein/Tfp pilus assembly protein PilF